MMAITTRSSIRVKQGRITCDLLCDFEVVSMTGSFLVSLFFDLFEFNFYFPV